MEQVLQPENKAPRLQAAEGLTVDELVDLYCGGGYTTTAAEAAASTASAAGSEDGEEAPAAVAAAAPRLSEEAAAVVRQAVAAAREAAGGAAAASGSFGQGAAGVVCTDLELESVTMCGYGPFVEEQVRARICWVGGGAYGTYETSCDSLAWVGAPAACVASPLGRLF